VAGDSVWAIVVAGGAGRRYGGTKQFELLEGRPVHAWAVEAARSVADGVVLVVPEHSDEFLPGRKVSAAAPSLGVAIGADVVVTGGGTRAASVRAGLAAVPPDAGVIVVHDAVRPLASAALFQAVVEAVRAGAPGAIPGLPVADTVKEVDGDVVRATLDRRILVRVQTPQGFLADVLRRAHEGLPEATDDASLLEALGTKVIVVAGEEHNLKITTPSDLGLAEWWLGQRRRATAGGSGAAGGGAGGAGLAEGSGGVGGAGDVGGAGGAEGAGDVGGAGGAEGAGGVGGSGGVGADCGSNSADHLGSTAPT
jgi:2-C-methyl-D-erythritol 4-phosphate cytidylyltransferase